MIKYLLELGIDEKNIRNIMQFNGINLDDDIEEMKKIVFLLKNIDMNEDSIKELIISNPMILNRTYEDIYNLVLKLKEYKFDGINYLFESNPYFINYDAYEIEEYYNSKKKSIEEITELIENNPFIMEED